jgi:hypothetical protein
MKNLFSIFLVFFCLSTTYAQIGIKANGTAPISSAQLEVQSTNKAFYPPRMTTTQRTSFPNAPQAGAVVYDTDLNGLFTFNGSAWVAGSGLTLPYSVNQNYGDDLLSITNLYTLPSSGAIYGKVYSSRSSYAIVGIAANIIPDGDNRAVGGINSSINSYGSGVYGEHQGFGVGVYGSCNSGTGVFGESISGTGGYFSSSTGRALITGIGKVGIGVPNPNQILDVNGRMRIRHTAGNTSGLWMSNSVNGLNFADGAFWGMKLDTESGVFIGNDWRFWVNNLGNGYLNGNLIQTSDRRLKKGFLLLSNSLSGIYQLKGYHYKWIEASRSQDLQTGLIAQEVQKIFPELVQTDEKGFLSVNYIGLIPHLIEAVKELKDENNQLKNKNQKLENRLDKIEEILSLSASKK